MEKDPEKMIRKRFKNSFFISCVIFAVLIFIGLTFPALAQITPSSAPGDGGNPCPGGEPCNPEVPITGIEWLIAIGGLFGFRKIYYKLKRG